MSHIFMYTHEWNQSVIRASDAFGEYHWKSGCNTETKIASPHLDTF